MAQEDPMPKAVMSSQIFDHHLLKNFCRPQGCQSLALTRPLRISPQLERLSPVEISLSFSDEVCKDFDEEGEEESYVAKV